MTTTTMTNGPLMHCLLLCVWAVAAFLQGACAFTSQVVPQRTTGQRQWGQKKCGPFFAQSPNFYNDFEGYNEDNSNNDDDDDDDDDLYLTSTMTQEQMDWRTFRRNLASQAWATTTTSSSDAADATSSRARAPSISAENQDLLRGQSKALHAEFSNGAWAHITATPEVGGLVVRLPLEVELQRNYKHSVTGARLQREYRDVATATSTSVSDLELWYKRAQTLIENDFAYLTEEAAGADGHIDASTLTHDMAEMLQLYLDHQETWQEVCLVLEHEPTEATTTLVLNRPMAMKLTENLAQLVLYGAFRGGSSQKKKKTNRPSLNQFLRAFGGECAVYIGGPDKQDQPAELIHGIAELPGAHEIAPNTGIYRGGLQAAVDGVIAGLYKPLDFRFFVGRHEYQRETGSSSTAEELGQVLFESAPPSLTADTSLDLQIVLGKYQPIACARAVALKQCISLPKPLWHEVLELCGGEMHEISQLELEKRDDVQIQIVDEDEDDEDDIPDELDELTRLDEEDEDDYDDDDYHRRRR